MTSNHHAPYDPPQKGTLTYTDVLHNDFFFCYEESIPTFSWELADGDTIIIGYPCHKAVCKFRGRTWTAWYSLDLPFDNGPWKLGGLPGLILAASESRHEFSFVATGIEQMRQTATICFQPKRYLRSTPVKFQHLLEDYWKDQWNTSKRGWYLNDFQSLKRQPHFIISTINYNQ